MSPDDIPQTTHQTSSSTQSNPESTNGALRIRYVFEINANVLNDQLNDNSLATSATTKRKLPTCMVTSSESGSADSSKRLKTPELERSDMNSNNSSHNKTVCHDSAVSVNSSASTSTAESTIPINRNSNETNKVNDDSSILNAHNDLDVRQQNVTVSNSIDEQEVVSATSAMNNVILPNIAESIARVLSENSVATTSSTTNNVPNNNCIEAEQSATVPPQIKQEIIHEDDQASSSNVNSVDIRPLLKVKKEEATSTTRESCRYGIRCYRRNPQHRITEAHPGDQDYRRPSYPQPPAGTPSCPFGNQCYRRNPAHFQKLSHPPSTDFAQNRRNHKIQKQKINSTNSDSSSDEDDDSDDPFEGSDDEDRDFLPEGDDDDDDDDDEEGFLNDEESND